ncbi:MAG TPA: lysozyme [Actinocrinis sp.]|nr:lysozyme [Actinocrinis sp.]HEV2346634.1 lysozyme [Actinocrinis sp.]
MRTTHTASRRAAVLVTASVLFGSALIGSIPAASASAAPPSGSGGWSWATTASGQRVAVRPTNYPTPVNPEQITHPLLDHMGSTIPAHESTAVTAHIVRPASTVPQIPGIDISGYQGNINWGAVAPYIDFVYIKATEGTYYTNPYFAQQYNGSYNSGLIRGSYHFAIPNNSSGTTQADYFIAHGGGWSADGKTLPGALDIEYNPYGSECYGFSQSSMVNWVWNFVNEYAAREHAYPVIYSTTDWWSTCTGNYSGFAAYDPLWIANYSASGGGPLPAGWGYYTFWQYASSGSQPGDQDVFNGAYSRLQALATAG